MILFRRFAIASLLLVAGCGGGSSTTFDLAGADLGPRACGNLTCPGDQACLTGVPGFPRDMGGSQISWACAPLPDACQNDRTCACLNAHGGSMSFCQMALPNLGTLNCGGGASPADFTCGGM
jgi:hypothetical protein